MSSDADKDKQIAELQLKIAKLEREKAELLIKIETNSERQIFSDAGINPYAPLPRDYGPLITERYNQLYRNSNSGNSIGGKSKRNKKSKRRNSKKRL